MFFSEFDITEDGEQAVGTYNLVVIENPDTQPPSILLGRKTRGYGEGLWVLPGGREEANEDGNIYVPDEAAREVREEVNLTDLIPELIMPAGELIILSRGIERYVSIQRTIKFGKQEVKASDELADPTWFPKSALPFERMPEDYRYWLPPLLGGWMVQASFEVEDTVIVRGQVLCQPTRFNQRPRVVTYPQLPEELMNQAL
jgi:8-oxo-dGTP diphosphatase